MNATQPPYNTAALRRLMLQAFSDEEFTIFCYDHFREVRQQFTTGMTFRAKTQLLIEYCERTNAFPHLLPLLAEANPAKYAEFADSLQKSAPQSPITNLSQAHTEQSPITNLQSPLSPRQPFEPEMILIPAGEFLMGSNPLVDKYAQDDEQPQHRLYLPDYYLAKTPVTNAQFLAFVRATNYRTTAEQEGWGWVWVWTNKAEQIKGADWQHPHGQSNVVKKYDHPVLQVSWYDALAYCNWLTEVTGKPYRLPSEAEWEKGARGTDGWIYPWGNKWDAKYCNSSESGLRDTTPVGAYPNGASPYGLLDMAGNVWEWTRSLWGQDRQKLELKYPYRPGNGREDLNADDKVLRVLRGGSWFSNEEYARCADRDRHFPDNRNFIIGFRVVSAIW